jgi:hypothetical protein
MPGGKSRPRSVGDYLERAACPLGKSKFAERLSNFLATQPPSPTLTPVMINTLYQITSDFLKISPAVESMERDRFLTDLRAQEAVLKKLATQLRRWTGLASARRNLGLPGARVLERSLRMKFRREIDDVELRRRTIEANRELFRDLCSKSAQMQGLIRELDVYLKDVCSLRPKQRNLVIGAVLKMLEPLSDPVSVVPMRRSTATSKLKDVELSVDWINQLPGYRRPEKPRRSRDASGPYDIDQTR